MDGKQDDRFDTLAGALFTMLMRALLVVVQIKAIFIILQH